MAQIVQIEKLPHWLEKYLKQLAESQKRTADALERIADSLESEERRKAVGIVDQNKYMLDWMRRYSEVKREGSGGDSGGSSDGTHCA